MAELRPARSRADLRPEPILRSSASETSSPGTRWKEEVGFSGIRIGTRFSFLQHHKNGCPTRRGFRRVGTMDACRLAPAILRYPIRDTSCLSLFSREGESRRILSEPLSPFESKLV